MGDGQHEQIPACFCQDQDPCPGFVQPELYRAVLQFSFQLVDMGLAVQGILTQPVMFSVFLRQTPVFGSQLFFKLRDFVLMAVIVGGQPVLL
jgi:hypothetical protein